jgi:large subunit ribosomal protein L6
MSMTIPPFVKLEHDEATRKAYVTVDDREVKKQREMWGMTSLLTDSGKCPDCK